MNFSIDNFKKSLTPSNYFITKSMEISKISDSGTLWYFKKFLVIYNSIFLSQSIRTKSGIDEIISEFDTYINSLPIEQQTEAKKFFYPDKVNIKSNYKTYYDFAGTIQHSDKKAEHEFFAIVDKYYFVYLMDIGGQSGVKEYIKQKLYSSSFQVKNLDSIIKSYDRNINAKKLVQIKNDYHASLRNERQILFYYGFVHSRTTGAHAEQEFCSLTPIGELAIKANASEFRVIWEHQKLKMISQPVTVEFPSIKGCKNCDSTKFKLNFHPYLTILKCLLDNKKISKDYYLLILSRSKNDNIGDLISKYAFLNEKKNISLMKKYIENFNVKSDIKVEDFEKEIKKYLLGIRSDFPKDFNTNILGVCAKDSNNGWIVTDEDKLLKIFNIYNNIEQYKTKRYKDLFKDCELELREKYKSTSQNKEYKPINPTTKIRWDLYNIHMDKVIILALLVDEYIIRKQLDLEDIKIKDFINFINTDYKNIIKFLSLDKISLNNLLKDVLVRLIENKLKDIKVADDYIVSIKDVENTTDVDIKKIEKQLRDVSEENIRHKLPRERDYRIIDLIRHYYIAKYLDENKLIKCECCNGTTFPKQNNEPYLEFHHLIPFSVVDGPDHYYNIYGVCPMCHRKIHHAKDTLKSDLYKNFNKNNHYKINIIDRLKKLYEEQALKSYQLEYALAEHMIDESDYDNIIQRY